MPKSSAPCGFTRIVFFDALILIIWKFDPNPQLPAHVKVKVHFPLADTSPEAKHWKYCQFDTDSSVGAA
jgi:hypothetical protein